MMGRGSPGALSDMSAVHFVVLAAVVAHMFTARPLVAHGVSMEDHVAVQSSGQVGGPGSGPALVFGPPVVLPVFCPQSLCKYGGSTAADDFTAFPPPHNNVIIGSVNRSVTYSTDNGATFQMMDSASAKINEAKSVIGPGVLFPCGSNSSSLCSLGGTTLDGIDPSVVNASIVSRWTLPSGLKSQDPPRRDVNTTADVVWDLPDGSHACQFVGYAGKVLQFRGTWIKTMILINNCTAPPKPGWGSTGHADIHLFESDDPALPSARWRWRSLVCAAAMAGGEEGANENDVVVVADGSLLVIFRVDGGDGYPDHRHTPFRSVRSTDGLSWSPPVELPAGILSARPQMAMLSPSGPLVLTGGRPHLMLWLSSDGNGESWFPYNLAAEHNLGITDPTMRFCPAFANGTSTWLESTCYNSIMRIEDGLDGEPRGLVCYDRMGTEPPDAPPECQPKEVYTFCMQFTFQS